MKIGKTAVGLVEPKRFVWTEAFELQHGDTLPGFELIYETYGQLNSTASNAILVCHALSGNHHAAGIHQQSDAKPGWWDACIGPDKPIDTNLFFVLSLNNLGGCHGSTGPNAINPTSGQCYGPDFPSITVKDWVKSQALLADSLNIKQFAAIIGGSLGGMQALQWAMDFPHRVRAAIPIASAARLSAQNIAFNEIARQAITADPDYQQGWYYNQEVKPDLGLRLARMVGHVTYLSDDGMRRKFGRELKSGNPDLGEEIEFQVESYLRYQGRAFSRRFDANTYLLMTRALDHFDPAAATSNDLAAALTDIQCPILLISFSSDWRFAPIRSREIADALIAAGKKVSYVEIESEHGHDSFLMPLPRYVEVLSTYLKRLFDELPHAA